MCLSGVNQATGFLKALLQPKWMDWKGHFINFLKSREYVSRSSAILVPVIKPELPPGFSLVPNLLTLGWDSFNQPPPRDTLGPCRVLQRCSALFYLLCESSAAWVGVGNQNIRLGEFHAAHQTVTLGNGSQAPLLQSMFRNFGVRSRHCC